MTDQEEEGPTIEALRGLPVREPDARAVSRTRASALAELSRATSLPPWLAPIARFGSRGLVPLLVTGGMIWYLLWAVTMATRFYSLRGEPPAFVTGRTRGAGSARPPPTAP